PATPRARPGARKPGASWPALPPTWSSGTQPITARFRITTAPGTYAPCGSQVAKSLDPKATSLASDRQLQSDVLAPRSPFARVPPPGPLDRPPPRRDPVGLGGDPRRRGVAGGAPAHPGRLLASPPRGHAVGAGAAPARGAGAELRDDHGRRGERRSGAARAGGRAAGGAARGAAVRSRRAGHLGRSRGARLRVEEPLPVRPPRRSRRGPARARRQDPARQAQGEPALR